MSSWLKMETSLRDSPKIALIADKLNTSEAEVIGGLFILWAIADSQTEDGFLEGMTTGILNRKAGIEGFAEAVIAFDWLSVDERGLLIPNYEAHNSASAKKRANTAKRQAKHKSQKLEAESDKRSSVTQDNAQALPSALPREEKNREDKKKDITPTPLKGEWDIFPNGSLNKTVIEQKRIRVMKNNSQMILVGKWFQRKESTLWTVSEAKSLQTLNPLIEEVELMGAWRETKNEYHRRDLQTLLNNWSTELDRARQAPELKELRSKTPAEHREDPNTF